MQTALKKIGEHFDNMLSTSGGLRPLDPLFLSHKIVYIINDVNVVNTQPASSNRDYVATSEAYQTPLNKCQTLW